MIGTVGDGEFSRRNRPRHGVVSAVSGFDTQPGAAISRCVMPQILKSNDELRRMILDEVRSYVVCPEGTDVTVRADPDYGWTADVVPPPGSVIAEADCIYYIGHVVRRLRVDFDLLLSD